MQVFPFVLAHSLRSVWEVGTVVGRRCKIRFLLNPEPSAGPRFATDTAIKPSAGERGGKPAEMFLGSTHTRHSFGNSRGGVRIENRRLGG